MKFRAQSDKQEVGRIRCRVATPAVRAVRLGKTERYRRVIAAAYARILLQDVGTEQFLDDLSLLDAMQDCIEEDSSAWSEWTVSADGVVQFG